MAEEKKSVVLPPHSIEAEKAVLGCMLINPEAAPRVLHILSEKSFYTTAHSQIFSE